MRLMWDWSFTVQILPDLCRGLWITVQAVLFGMLIALVLGLVWAVARRARARVYAMPAGCIVEFIRSTPLLVQLYFFYYVLPDLGVTLGPFLTGVLALGLHYSCYTSEVYRAGINGIPKGQWEAARALNLSTSQTYWRVILPQAIPPVIPALGNYLIAMFKDTPLLSAITVLEVLARAENVGKEYGRFLEPLTLVGIMYILLSLGAGLLVGSFERRLKLEKV